MMRDDKRSRTQMILEGKGIWDPSRKLMEVSSWKLSLFPQHEEVKQVWTSAQKAEWIYFFMYLLDLLVIKGDARGWRIREQRVTTKKNNDEHEMDGGSSRMSEAGATCYYSEMLLFPRWIACYWAAGTVRITTLNKVIRARNIRWLHKRKGVLVRVVSTLCNYAPCRKPKDKREKGH